jgi:spectinomycin phosphotransferase
VKVAPPGIDVRTLAAQLAGGWGVTATAIDYLPEGFGSYHWVAATETGERLFLTVDDLANKPWLGGDPGAVFSGLEACFDGAVALRDRAGLEFVVAPRPDCDGASVRRMAEGYSLAVFPFVDGRTGRWGEPLPARARAELIDILAGLHGATATVATVATVGKPVPSRGWDLPGRDDLEAALADVDRQWGSGPYGEPARHLLVAYASEVRDWLAAYDGLATALSGAGAPLVVTHGEPHPGNLLRARDRLYLIDWDTVALAPRERDLWMLAGSPQRLDRYVAATGRTPDPQALRFYRLTWALQDLAAFLSVMRAPHDDDLDTEKAWHGLGVYLSDEGQPYPWA